VLIFFPVKIEYPAGNGRVVLLPGGPAVLTDMGAIFKLTLSGTIGSNKSLPAGKFSRLVAIYGRFPVISSGYSFFWNCHMKDGKIPMEKRRRIHILGQKGGENIPFVDADGYAVVSRQITGEYIHFFTQLKNARIV